MVDLNKVKKALEEKHMAKKEDAKIVPAATVSVAPVTDVNELPDYLKEMVGHTTGMESADQEDFTLPRLAICQDLTPHKKKSSPKYVEGLQVGDFFNTITGEIYGPKINVLPLFFTKQRIKFNTPIGSGIDCQSLNGKTGGRHSETCKACPYSKFKDKPDDKGSTAPACTEFKNMVVLVQTKDGLAGPLLFSNKSTAITIMKQWMSFMKMDNMPVFSKTYTLTSAVTTKNNNEFFVWNFNQLGYVPKEIFLRAKAYFDTLHDKDISFNPEDIEAEEEEGSQSTAF